MLQVEALEIMKTGANIFLTGVPGAGKTYVVNKYVEWLRDKGIWPAITASTGIAATHIGGSTIHSFSGIGIEKDLDEYKIEKIMEREKLVKKIQNTSVLIVDEISMLDAATLDNVNKVLKAIKDPTKAFGGVQVIFVGDFFQLPPVTRRGEETKYFAFHSNSWKEARPLTCYLEEQFRQTDETFTKLLLAIRENNIDEMHIEILEELKSKTEKKFRTGPSPLAPLQRRGEEWQDAEIEYEEGVKIKSYIPELVHVAKENRKELTPAEKLFWEMVRADRLGYDFVREKPIGQFIVDFFCKDLNLVVEIDGGYHLEEKEKARDIERENILKGLGMRILRFTNQEVILMSSEELEEKLVALVPLSIGEGSGERVMDDVAETNDILELHSHNKNVDEINDRKLNLIKGKENIYKMETFGRGTLIEGLIKSCLSPEILKLKVGAKVIFTKNDMEGKYVNGTMGTVKDLDNESIVVETSSNKLVEAKKEEWAIEEDGKVKARIMQYPLRLAWAITVHKSQGMSLDEAIINLGDTFEYGQGYVALSRVRSLDGLYLKSYNPKSLRVNEAISEFDEKIRKDSRFIQEKFEVADKKKLQKTQNEFIERCGGKVEGGVKREFGPSQEKKETQIITLELINSGKSLKEISEIRDIGIRTLYKHVEELFKFEKINKNELGKIVKKELEIDIFNVPNEVKKSFKKNKMFTDEEGNIKMSPVFKEFDGKYTYEVLRFYRLFI